jgi:hypothetical protein
MTVEGEIRRIALLLAVAFALSGCEWTKLDAIAPGVSEARDDSYSGDITDASTDVWSDNGTVSLVPRAWTCVSLPISPPS